MKSLQSTVTTLAAVVLLSATLGGCSLFRSTATDSPSVGVPSSSDPAAAVATQPTTVPSVQAVAPSPTPAAPTSAPVPRTVPGYTLSTPSATVQRRFAGVAGQFRGVFSGLTARTVVKGQQQVGTVVLLGLHPELVGNTTVEQRLVPGMVKGMSGQGAKVTTQKVNGQDVAVATTKSTNIVAWYHSGTVVLVLANGTNTSTSLAFVKAYLAAR